MLSRWGSNLIYSKGRAEMSRTERTHPPQLNQFLPHACMFIIFVFIMEATHVNCCLSTRPISAENLPYDKLVIFRLAQQAFNYTIFCR